MDSLRPLPDPDGVARARRFGPYALIAELARGGMGVLYLALARAPGGGSRLCVIKEIKPELAADTSFVAMFLNEGRLLTRLVHPNIVQAIEVGTDGDRPYLAMEFLNGKTISQITRRAKEKGTPLPAELAENVIAGVLAGLHHVHTLCSPDGKPLEMVHRDISPQNVFVTYDGHVKLIDFGIAKTIASPIVSATGTIKGKFAFMAPEQLLGLPTDPRSDLFSTGILLFELATGRRLWGEAVAEVVVMNRLGKGEIPAPLDVDPTLSERLADIVRRATQFQPDARYSSATEMQDALGTTRVADRVAAQRDLGAFVTKLFDGERQEVDAVVKTEIARATTSEDSGSMRRLRTGFSTLETSRPDLPRVEKAKPEKAQTEKPPEAPPVPASRLKPLAIGGLIVMCIGATAYLALKPQPTTVYGTTTAPKSPAAISSELAPFDMPPLDPSDTPPDSAPSGARAVTARPAGPSRGTTPSVAATTGRTGEPQSTAPSVPRPKPSAADSPQPRTFRREL
jgi:eukaryotic-like serine/threonine-protein kinase